MPSVPPDLLARPAPEAVRLLCLACLDDAAAALGRLADPEDGEALHDFRVAIRRLRSCVRAWREELRGSVRGRDRRRLRRLAAATGGGRDAEVQLAWLEARRSALAPEEGPGLEVLVARLEPRRREGYEAAARVVAARFAGVEAGLRERLGRYRLPVRSDGLPPAETYAAALAGRLPAHGSELAARLSDVRSAADEEAAHAARIAAKRLRYLVEPARGGVEEAKGLVERLKSLQDVLGELHDAHVLTAEVARAMEESAAADAQPGSAGDPRAGLRAVLRLARREQERLFGRLREEWLEGGAAGFFAALDGLGRRLRGTAGAGVEIERKFLLTALPAAVRGRVPIGIEQGWLPGERLQERLRRVRVEGKETYYRTVKLGEGVRRIEVEEETDARTFEALWPLTRGRRVSKLRYRVPEGELVWEVDEFTDRDLVLAEVELPSPQARPPLPAWLAPHVAREVTGEPAFVNVNLAR